MMEFRLDINVGEIQSGAHAGRNSIRVELETDFSKARIGSKFATSMIMRDHEPKSACIGQCVAQAVRDYEQWVEQNSLTQLDGHP